MQTGINSPETFRACKNPEDKLNMLYDAVAHIVESDKRQCTTCDNRLTECTKQFNQIRITMRKNRKVDMAVAGGGGFIGGFTAMLAKWLLAKS